MVSSFGEQRSAIKSCGIHQEINHLQLHRDIFSVDSRLLSLVKVLLSGKGSIVLILSNISNFRIHLKLKSPEKKGKICRFVFTQKESIDKLKQTKLLLAIL